MTADPIGTVRRAPYAPFWVVVKTVDPEYPWQTIQPLTDGERSAWGFDSDVARWPVIGAVPCTPAAEIAPADDDEKPTRQQVEAVVASALASPLCGGHGLDIGWINGQAEIIVGLLMLRGWIETQDQS